MKSEGHTEEDDDEVMEMGLSMVIWQLWSLRIASHPSR
jgi:hypothetical protein